ncbi:MAG: class I SAM-dependent methyltransferase, partial [Aggregatilineales bacterium]
RITATEFDATRGRAWQGWEAILPYIPDTASLSVLDVGCGNGRFAIFLDENISTPISYHGVDNSAKLLTFAKKSLFPLDLQSLTLTEQDIITQPPDTGQYNLVGLFGVMHHIPGAEHRLSMMKTLAERVLPGGLLIFAAWRFYEYERFSRRFVDAPADLPLEKGDFLLDWRRGERALRYCHYVDDAEHDALVAATGFTELKRYRADGSDNRMNCYSILQNPS